MHHCQEPKIRSYMDLVCLKNHTRFISEGSQWNIPGNSEFGSLPGYEAAQNDDVTHISSAFMILHEN